MVALAGFEPRIAGLRNQSPKPLEDSVILYTLKNKYIVFDGPSPYCKLSSSIFSHIVDKSEHIKRLLYTSCPITSPLKNYKCPHNFLKALGLTRAIMGLITHTFHGMFRIIITIFSKHLF